MVVFEVSVNGKRTFAMASGDFGMLTASVMWHRIQSRAGPIHEGIELLGRGLEPNGGKHLGWPKASLKVGDEVLIRIVDSMTFDEPAERFTLKEMESKLGEMEAKTKDEISN